MLISIFILIIAIILQYFFNKYLNKVLIKSEEEEKVKWLL